MSRPSIFGDFEARCVEPVKRMCGGRFGWVVHRFPIKRGLPRRVLLESWNHALAREAARPSFIAPLLGKPSSPSPVLRTNTDSGVRQ